MDLKCVQTVKFILLHIKMYRRKAWPHFSPYVLMLMFVVLVLWLFDMNLVAVATVFV